MESRLTFGPAWWRWSKHLKQPVQARSWSVCHSLEPMKASGLLDACLVSHS